MHIFDETEQQRQRAEARKRAGLLDLVYKMLANDPRDTVTGATLVLPSGERLYVDIRDARSHAGKAPVDGGAA